MATAVVTVKVMPSSPEVNLDEIKEKVQAVIREFTERDDPADQKVEVEPVAFGLKALKIIFTMDEAKGSPDAIEEKVKAIEGVQSFEVTDVRRAVG
jgi:elongation factor 1-beta